MSNKKKITLNYIYSSLYQIILIIVPFITAPYLSRTLQPEAVGINSYVSAVVKTFSLLGLIGLNNYSIREVAYVRKDKSKLSKTFSEFIILRTICCIITFIIYMIYAHFSEYKIYLIIQLIALFSAFLDISWLYMGLEEFKVTVTRSMIVKVINVISIFLFIHGPEDLGLFMVISTIFTVIGNTILYFGVKKRIGEFDFKELNIKRHIIPTIRLFLPQIASTVFLQIDKVMIKYLAPAIATVGFYDQAERIVKVPLALITALSTIMLPRISYEFKNNNNEIIKKYITKAIEFSMLLAIPLMFGLISISKTMIPWFLGPGYTDVISIMMFVSPIVLFNALSSVSGLQYLTATDKTKILTISYVAGATANLVINYFLIPIYGGIGAAIGTVAAELIIFLIQFIYIKSIINLKSFIKSLLKYFICGIIMFIPCHTIGKFFSSTIIVTLSQIITGVIVYFLALFIFKDELFKEILLKGVSIIKDKLKINKKGDTIAK